MLARLDSDGVPLVGGAAELGAGAAASSASSVSFISVSSASGCGAVGLSVGSAEAGCASPLVLGTLRRGRVSLGGRSSMIQKAYLALHRSALLLHL